MIRTSLTGVISVIVIFVILAVALASQITVGGAAIAIPGLPAEPEPVSLLDSIWQHLAGWLGGLW
jgi:hypothetical protein